MLWLWFLEHWVGIYSLKKLAMAEPIVSVLIKQHIYSITQKEESHRIG
jgi:hypothetical protein